ncbi:MAG: glycosyltransferase family 2 protein [Clostridia bacterium]|nr:glycosyltransferase family 2 protein [Clostridia bacterium]
MNNLVSFIVPVYNVEKYLKECLDSIKNQTYTNFECLLIDDGSTDGSGKICDDFCNEDNRFKVFHIENGGVSNARNYGLSLFKGDYVTFIDSDDYISKYYLEVLLYLIKKTGTQVALSQIKRVEHMSYIVIDENIEALKNDYMLYNALETWINKIHLSSVSVLYSKKSVENIYFNTNLYYGEDLCFLTDVFLCSKNIVKTNMNLYFYRLNPNSAMNSPFNIKKMTEIDAYNILINKYSFSKKLQNEIKAFFCSRLLVMLNNFYNDNVFRKQYFKSVIKLYRKNLKYMLKKDTFKQKLLHIFLAVFPRLYLNIRKQFKKK